MECHEQHVQNQQYTVCLDPSNMVKQTIHVDTKKRVQVSKALDSYCQNLYVLLFLFAAYLCIDNYR